MAAVINNDHFQVSVRPIESVFQFFKGVYDFRSSCGPRKLPRQNLSVFISSQEDVLKLVNKPAVLAGYSDMFTRSKGVVTRNYFPSLFKHVILVETFIPLKLHEEQIH